MKAHGSTVEVHLKLWNLSIRGEGGIPGVEVKSCSSTVELPLILLFLSIGEVAGIRGVAVKCIDTIKNTDSEGSLLDRN